METAGALERVLTSPDEQTAGQTVEAKEVPRTTGRVL